MEWEGDTHVTNASCRGETPALYTVIPEKPTSVGGAMMGSSYTYDVGTGGGSAPKKVSQIK